MNEQIYNVRPKSKLIYIVMSARNVYIMMDIFLKKSDISFVMVKISV